MIFSRGGRAELTGLVAEVVPTAFHSLPDSVAEFVGTEACLPPAWHPPARPENVLVLSGIAYPSRYCGMQQGRHSAGLIVRYFLGAFLLVPS